MPAQRGIETGEMCPQCGKPLVTQLQQEDAAASSSAAPGLQGEAASTSSRARARSRGRQPVETEYKCPTCGKPMLRAHGQSGPFLGCSGYPECKTTMNFDAEGKPVLSAKPTEHTCEKCGKPMVIREGRRGPFLACTGYPKCRNAKDVDADGNPVKPIDIGHRLREVRLADGGQEGLRAARSWAARGYPKCRSTKPMPEELKEKLKDHAAGAGAEEGGAGGRGAARPVRSAAGR